MSPTTATEDALTGFEFHLVERHPNLSVIRFKAEYSRQSAPRHGERRPSEMTQEDWDKFEKDIADAFEQVP